MLKMGAMGPAEANRDRGTPGLAKALTGAAMVLLALVCWSNRDFVSSWFATSYTATIEFATLSERDDGRISRAFAAAQSAHPSDATLELLPDQSQIRHSVVHVPGQSPAEAIAAAESLSQAVVAAFNADDPGQLDVRVGRWAAPDPGPASNGVLAVLTYSAPLLGLVGVILLWLGWHDWPPNAHMPREVVFGVMGGSFAFIVVPLMLPGWLFAALFAMAVPGSLAGAILYKMRDVRRAARWPSAQGRIVRSKMRAVRHKQAGEATTVSNVPAVEYVFIVGGVEYRGNRISIGEIAAGTSEAEAALERYQVGRTGPVFYNPDKPQEAVLERDPPLRPAAMYGIAAGVMLVGLAVVIAFTGAGEIIDWLQPYFPPGAFVPGVLFFAAAGILMSLFLLLNRRAAVVAARWPTTTGAILSSAAELRRGSTPGRTQRTMTVWSPVVEYVYRVDGRDYHGTRLALGADVAASRDFAEATVARYPAGREVTVHFDPANPSFAVLEARIAFAWLTLLLTVAFFAAALFFSGWRAFS